VRPSCGCCPSGAARICAQRCATGPSRTATGSQT
jgi:hypothetical protein